MILVTTPPLIALFDPRDPAHRRCRRALKRFREPLCTTIPVLTEVHLLLAPGSMGSAALSEFITSGGLVIWYMDSPAYLRAMELMSLYSDERMDLAEASLIAAAERTDTRLALVLEHRELARYRALRGHRHVPMRTTRA